MISHNGINKANTRPTVDIEVDQEDIAHLAGLTDSKNGLPKLILGKYTFKCAETEDELSQVHQLNYQTFVEEIGQHPDPGTEFLVDKFHDKNTYFIAMLDGEVVGMLASHDEPPFSVTSRLPDPVKLKDLGGRIMEARLFAIKPDKRYGPVTRGLIWLVYEYAQVHDYSYLVISGIASRTRLYERLGFRALGPAVRDGDASFVPMALCFEQISDRMLKDANRVRRKFMDTVGEQSHAPVSLLPGPVHIADSIREAVSERPESHRGEEFIKRYEHIRKTLSEMVSGLETAIMVGSGTLANEVVAASLAADRSAKRGLILNNGEFGRRLAAQAMRYELAFQTFRWDWGQSWDIDAIRNALNHDPDINWIWATHLETSTGMLNNIDALFDLAEEYGAKVCLDCVSSLGGVETNIKRAHLATGVSGKSIGALAGLAFIFAHKGALDAIDTNRVPNYLDLKTAMETEGPRFTVSSPLLYALGKAVDEFETEEKRRERFDHYKDMGRYVRKRLIGFGIQPLVTGPDAAPIITSFKPPDGLTSEELFDLCLSWGFEISGLSGYLLEQGIVQFATMGAVTKRDCARLFARMRLWMSERQSKAGTSV